MAEPSIGTAGWSIPSPLREAFPGDGSHLERYAERLPVVEINSSFYRPHQRKTYARWAASVGQDFRFSVKLPKTISHARYAPGLEPAIERFADEVAGLGDKLGVVLVQFPPSLAYDQGPAERLLLSVATHIVCPLVCEPRHASWFTPAADALLEGLRVARVAADPPTAPGADQPGGWAGLRYRRLHGSPRIYYSPYETDALDRLELTIAGEASTATSWCIFDNTAAGAATENALALQAAFAARTHSAQPLP